MKKLATVGSSIGVWEMQGHLSVFGMELVVREVISNCDDIDYMIFDFRRVSATNEPAAGLFVQFLESIAGRVQFVFLTHVERQPMLLSALRKSISTVIVESVRLTGDTDEAIERCESYLLAEHDESDSKPATGLEQFDIVESFNHEQISILLSMMRPGHARDRDYIVREGDDADGVYFLLRGSASVIIEPQPGKVIRLSTCSTMMTFGEMALLDHKPRSASVRADGEVDYLFLSIAEYEKLRMDRPDIALRLLENMSRGLSDKLRRANEEIRALGA